MNLGVMDDGKVTEPALVGARKELDFLERDCGYLDRRLNAINVVRAALDAIEKHGPGATIERDTWNDLVER